MAPRGFEYVVPAGVDLAAIRAALAARSPLVAAPVRTTDRTVYDTFDGRLHARAVDSLFDQHTAK